MALAADVFPKLRTTKNVVKQISKQFHFTGTFHKPHAKGKETL